MDKEQIASHKKNIIAIGRLLWEKNLVSGLNGNISRRIDHDNILLTGHGACLGLLQEKDILPIRLDGTSGETENVSSEKLLHTEIHKNFTDTVAVIHTHTNFTNAFFLDHKTFAPRIFESKMLLGTIRAVDQFTPAVTDAGSVLTELKSNNITVLRNHGVVAKGNDLFDCFLLIQGLEDAITVDAVSRLYGPVPGDGDAMELAAQEQMGVKKYKLFSQEQIDDIVKIVNADPQLKELGNNTKMTMGLAVQLDETGQTYSFNFEDGRITDVGNDPGAEFLISAPREVWRAVFNREIDPFVATTQKKMNLRGDFAKISKWYAPCSRIFELWQQVPVE
jgi:L-fuculose-phosphate aldolase